MIRYLVGDAREQLRELPDESVHCVVTSPPYWNLRSYHLQDGMIGLEDSMEEHIANLVDLFREVRRVLRKDGIFWLNYGDAYVANPGDNQRRTKWDNSPIQRKHRGSMHDYRKKVHNLKPKDMMQLPERLAIALQEDGAADHRALRTLGRVHDRLAATYPEGLIPGHVSDVLRELEEEYAEAKGESWWVRHKLVWHKRNAMPENVLDRPSKTHEYVLMLTRSRHYWSDMEAVRSAPKRATLERLARKGELRPSAWATSRRFHGDAPAEKRRFEERPHTGLDKGTRTEQMATGANMGSVLEVSPEGIPLLCPKCLDPLHQGDADRRKCSECGETFDEPLSHFAVFPRRLIDPLIRIATSEKGVCPECGAQWNRIVDRDLVKTSKAVRADYQAPKYAGDAQNRSRKRRADGFRPGWGYAVETKGWEPSCKCDPHEPVPATVLDPFSGAGTTGVVCLERGRDAILIEISPVYMAVARKRIRESSPMFYSE